MSPWLRCSGGGPRWQAWLSWPGPAQSSPDTARLPRLVQRDVQALRARAVPGRAGVVTEEMLSDLPEPVRRYLRYLSEMIWFPAAFLAGNVSFDPVDDVSARVTLTDHGRTATGTLFFDQEGRLTGFVAQRYRTADSSDPEMWSTPVTGYGEFEGLRLPVRGKAAWKLPGGDFEYIDLTVTELHYDTLLSGLLAAQPCR
jgi:hypothetical protein